MIWGPLLARVRLVCANSAEHKRLPFVGDATDSLQDVFFETSLLCHLSCNPTSRDFQNITGGNGIVIQRPVKRLQEEDGSSEMSEARGFGNGVGVCGVSGILGRIHFIPSYNSFERRGLGVLQETGEQDDLKVEAATWPRFSIVWPYSPGI